MNKKSIFYIVIALLLMAVIWYVVSYNKQSQEVFKVKFAYLPIVYNLPLYVAVEKGYFADAGIDVELVQFQAPNQLIDAIISGQVDFTAPGGPIGIPAIAEYKNPGKMIVYAISGEKEAESVGNSIIVPINSQITSIDQLKGKKFGILAGTIQWQVIAREILAQNGLDMNKDLTIVELAPTIQVQAISSGQVDALLALEPVPTIAINKGVAKILVEAPDRKFIADPMWNGAGVVGTGFAKKNPVVTDKVINILSRTIKEINENFDAYRQYLPQYTTLPDEIITKISPIDYKTCDTVDKQDKEGIQKYLDLFTKYQIVDGKINIDSFLCTL